MDRRTVANKLSEIAPAAVWVETRIATAKLPADACHDLHVCLEEALANLVLHGQPQGGDKQIEVEVEAALGGVVVRVFDRCVPFDVSIVAEPDATKTQDDRIGGHGLRLLRSFAHDLKYQSADGLNVLEMRFPIPDSPSALAADAEIVRQIPAFASLGQAALLDLVRSSKKVAFAPEDIILTQGSSSEFAVVVLSGAVAIVNQAQHGGLRLAQIAAPALVGEIGALAHLPRTAEVVAKEAVTALLIGRNALLDAGARAPDLLISVIGQLGQQIQNINSALSLYSAGFSALGRDDFDPSVLEDLNNPSGELKNFAEAFASLAKRVTAERRARAEIASAALIQRAMLPQDFDAASLRPRCDVFGDVKAAREVGGDLFDLSLVGPSRLALVIGDVCGKGIPASLFMCATVTALRLAARHERDLCALVEQANEALCAQNATSMFTTLFYGVLDLDARRLEYVNCGHNPPFIVSRTGGCSALSGGGRPLGFFSGQHWTKQVHDLAPSEGVFLFTDGVTECVDVHGEEYGEARLAATLRTLSTASATDLVRGVIADAQNFSAANEPFDDITCVAAWLD